MPVTFRTFFQGLAGAAPGIVNTIYQYRQDEIKNMFQERQMRLEEQKAGVYGEYMGAATEQAKTETKRITGLIPLEAELKNLEIGVQKNIQHQYDIKKAAAVGKHGSEQAAEEARLDRELIEFNLKNDELKARIAQAKSGIEVNAFHLQHAKLTAKQEQLDGYIKFAAGTRILATNIPAQEKWNQAVKDHFLDNGMVDAVGLKTYYLENLKDFYTPEQGGILLGMTDKLGEFSLIQARGRANYRSALDVAIRSTDSKVRDAALKDARVTEKEAFLVDPDDPDKKSFFDKGADAAALREWPMGVFEQRATNVAEPLSRIMGGFPLPQNTTDIYGGLYDATNPEFGPPKPSGKQPAQTRFNPAGMTDYPAKKAFKKATAPLMYPEY